MPYLQREHLLVTRPEANRHRDTVLVAVMTDSRANSQEDLKRSWVHTVGCIQCRGL